MRILFVRHGEPDYDHDCLTETGRRQAEAAAVRLQDEGICEIFSSPNGRAKETADCTARLLGLPVTVLPWMREISWGGEGIPYDGHPWTVSDEMMREEADLSRWREHPYFRGNVASRCYDLISEAFDRFMDAHGYARHGTRYLCRKDNNDSIAVFSHGGSGACVLSHLMDLPFPFVCSVMPYDYTSVIILDFPSVPDRIVFPRLELFNDTAHTALSGGPRIQETPDTARWTY